METLKNLLDLLIKLGEFALVILMLAFFLKLYSLFFGALPACP